MKASRPPLRVRGGLTLLDARLSILLLLYLIEELLGITPQQIGHKDEE